MRMEGRPYITAAMVCKARHVQSLQVGRVAMTPVGQEMEETRAGEALRIEMSRTPLSRFSSSASSEPMPGEHLRMPLVSAN